MRGLLQVILYAAMVLVAAGPVLAAAPGDAVVTEPTEVATANEAGRTDAPCSSDEEPPPPPPCSYHMAGGAGDLVIDAVVCDISQPFTVTGGNISVKFTPKAADPLSGGSYTYSGDFGSFSVAGKGTHKGKLTAEGGSMVANGPGVVKTPRGTFSAFGKEHYDLTPTTC